MNVAGPVSAARRLLRNLPGRGAAEKDSLELADIQGNILKGYHHAECAYLFFSVTDRVLARIWLGELADTIQTAADRPGAVAVNVGLTYAGLRELRVPATRLARLPADFRGGMSTRAAWLGDEVHDVDGRQVPVHWHTPFGPDGDLHLLVMVSGGSAYVDGYVAALRRDAWECGLAEVAESMIRGARLPGDAEHFGFADGLSNPSIDGVQPGRGPRTTPVAPGEFILGAPNEDGVKIDDSPSITHNGSYLVLRKLEQDADRFEEMVSTGAQQTGLTPDLVRAKLMGRWPGGAPLTAHPDAEPDHWEDTGFDYADDDGSRCPLGAHVRRANPRGALEFKGRLENRHRILRRGMPYGSRSAARSEDGTGYGLVFACYQTSIAGQFEFVQSQWLSDGNIFALSTDTDPVADTSATRSRRLRFEGRSRSDNGPARPPSYVETMHRCVTSRGGEYFLVPGITAIRNIAALNELYPDEQRALCPEPRGPHDPPDTTPWNPS